ncbi:hypothetical protein CDO43_40095, partial [Pseudomonas aeruginosa]
MEPPGVVAGEDRGGGGRGWGGGEGGGWPGAGADGGGVGGRGAGGGGAQVRLPRPTEVRSPCAQAAQAAEQTALGEAGREAASGGYV